MPRYRGRRPYSRGGAHKRSSRGYEWALQHIEESKQLSRELGGTDKDVKAYFFSLSPSDFQAILHEYGQKYGCPAREYAEQTMDNWRTGRVQMSGMVASRLFNLLPPRMPLNEKYTLIENLWKHVGPCSTKGIRVGLDVDVRQVIDVINDHIHTVVTNYKIPDGLQRRFEWIASGDVQIKQDLLNHLTQMEKSLVVDAAKAQLPIMLDHLRTNGTHTQRLAQILSVGKHNIEVLVDKDATGISLFEPTTLNRERASTSGSKGMVWLWLIGGALLLWSLVSK